MTRSLARALAASCALAVLSPGAARAEHGMPFLLPSPAPDTTLPRNPRIRLRSLNGIDWIFSQLARNTGLARATLVADGHRVPLRSAGFWDDLDHGQRRGSEGGYGEGLLELAPRSLLAAHTRYELEVRYLSRDQTWRSWRPWGWTTGARVDVRAPTWRSAPTVDADGRAVEIDLDDPGVVVVAALAVPLRGRPFPLRFVLDGTHDLGAGPTAHYPTAVARASQPSPDGPSRSCVTVETYTRELPPGARLRLVLDARDLAGNARAAPGRDPVVRESHDGGGVTLCRRSPPR